MLFSLLDGVFPPWTVFTEGVQVLAEEGGVGGIGKRRKDGEGVWGGSVGRECGGGGEKGVVRRMWRKKGEGVRVWDLGKGGLEGGGGQ